MNPKPTGLLVCMPTRGAVSIETMLCLRHHLDGYPCKLLTAIRKPVEIGRNALAKAALEFDAERLPFAPKYCLWVDDDAWWPAGHVAKAVSILETHSEVDAVSGVFCARKAWHPAHGILKVPAAPTLDEFPESVIAEFPDEVEHLHAADRFRYHPERYEDGELVPLRIGALHWNLMRRSLLEAVGSDPFTPMEKPLDFPSGLYPGKGDLMPEDFSFYTRANNSGRQIVIERSLLVGHVEIGNDRMYFPNSAPRFAKGLAVPQRIDTTELSGMPRRHHTLEGGEDVWKDGLRGASA
ncbi:MAG: glycosyltransferase family A protein [Candidatus Cybelea sp.]|jgi:hypothetical protein